VDGVNNDGSNVQRVKANHTIDDESLLVLAGIGVSTLNQTTTAKMGDYRERLLWSRAPIVGSGTGVSSTTAADGAPLWSVDDDVLPLTFFDNKTGEFSDTVQARVRTRLTVHFGNPFKDRRGDSLIPEAYTSQCPPLRRRGDASSGGGESRTPPGSPPHDNFTSGIEGEGEAIFAPIRKNTPDLEADGVYKRELEETTDSVPDEKRQRLQPTDASAGAVQPLPTPEKKPKPPPSKPSAPPPKPKAAPSRQPPRKPPPPAAPPSAQPAPPKASTPKPPPERQTSITSPKPPPPKPAVQPNAPPKFVASTQQANPPVSIAQQRPPPPKPSFVLSRSGAPAANVEQPPAAVVSANVQSPDNKPDFDLPTGWVCAWSKSQNRWYFFDQRSNKSVWQWPPPGGIPP
jgi:hypothetical protein